MANIESSGTGRTYGYARVSTTGQDLDRQLVALRDAGVTDARLVTETVSGAKERPELVRLLAWLEAGDTLVVDELSRLGRRTAEVVTLIDDLERRGVNLRVVTLGLDLRTPAGRMVAAVLAAAAELERDLLRQRVASSIEARRRRGGRALGGRPQALSVAQVRTARSMRAAGEMTMTEIAEALGVGRSTLYRALATTDA